MPSKTTNDLGIVDGRHRSAQEDLPPVLRVEFPAKEPLTRALIDRIAGVCDCAEDLGAASIVVLALGTQEIAEVPAITVDTSLLTQWEHVLRRLELLPAVTVAVARGMCDGTRAAILLTTDYRIAGPQFRLSLASSGPAELCGMIGYRLGNQLGRGLARSVVLWQAELSAEKALAHGILDDIRSCEEDAVREFLTRLHKMDRAGISIRRRLLLDDPSTSFEDALGLHLAACDRALRSRR